MPMLLHLPGVDREDESDAENDRRIAAAREPRPGAGPGTVARPPADFFRAIRHGDRKTRRGATEPAPPDATGDQSSGRSPMPRILDALFRATEMCSVSFSKAAR